MEKIIVGRKVINKDNKEGYVIEYIANKPLVAHDGYVQMYSSCELLKEAIHEQVSEEET